MTDEPLPGPIDFILIEFPSDASTEPTAQALAHLLDAGIVRLYDIVLIRKKADRSCDQLDLGAPLYGAGSGFEAFAGAQSGLFDDEDIRKSADALEPDTTALLIAFENCCKRTDSSPGVDRRSRGCRVSSLTKRRKERTMPGLLRGVARTAVVAGTATAVSGRVARRQAARYADRDAEIAAERQQAYEQEQMAHAPPPPPATAGAEQANTIQQLKDLAELKAQGVLTDEEFVAEKAKILGG